jgi:hypothetical protein
MASRFVRPETTRIEISDGDWLLVRSQLTAGEHRAVFNRMTANTMSVNERGVEGSMGLDPMKAGYSTILGYLLDWSLTDDTGEKVEIAGQPVEVIGAAVDALDLDTYQEIHEAIQAHEALVNERRLLEKKRRADAPRLLVT